MLKAGIPSSRTQHVAVPAADHGSRHDNSRCCSEPQAERSVKRFRGCHKSSHCLRQTAAVEAVLTTGDGSVVADLEAPFSPELMSGGG